MERNRKALEFVEQMAGDGVVCGASLAFVEKEGTRAHYLGKMGAAAPYDTRPVEAGLYYDLASLSKVVGTASRTMQLVQEGRLSLETQVKELLPRFQWEGITARNLLLHDSGLPAEIPDKASLTRENILERLYAVEPEAVCGERSVYSDVGFILLGLLILEAERRDPDGAADLEESFRQHVFGPLGMEHTSYRTEEKGSLCVPTEITEARGLICGQVHDSKAWLLGQSGSAGLFSTLEDVARFVQAYLERSPRLFQEETFRLIEETERFGRTYGWSKEYGSHTLYHTGFTGTSILMDLDRGRGMVLLTNRIHPTRNNLEFLERRRELNRIWLESGEDEGC